MKATRITICGDTASFRRTTAHVGRQPSYKVPPVTTILGLLSAAKGELVNMQDIFLAYHFSYRGTGEDLEKLNEVGNAAKTIPARITKSNIITREFLYDCCLTIYTTNMEFEKHFREPMYTLLLGRQNDLAYTTEIKEVELIAKQNILVEKTVIPYDENKDIAGEIVALPKEFSAEAVRKPKEIKQWIMVTTKQELKEGYYDEEFDRGLYFHGLEKIAIAR
jgi:CRISPR-associated protein Cas5t